VALADVDLTAAQQVAATLPAGSAFPVSCDVTEMESVRDAVRRTVIEGSAATVAATTAPAEGRCGRTRYI
jgi:hypothetical protein